MRRIVLAIGLSLGVAFSGCNCNGGGGNDGGAGGGAGGGGTGGGGANQLPTIQPIPPVIMTEQETKMVTIVATDPDGDTVTLTLSSPPQWASITGATLTLAPGLQDSGDVTLTVNANDGHGGTASTTVQVTVLNAGVPPVWTALAPMNADEGQTLNVTLMATDPDGAAVTYSLTTNPPAWASIAGNMLTLAVPYDVVMHGGVVPPPDATVTIFLKATASAGGEAPATLTLVVKDVNRPPDFPALTAISVDEGQTQSTPLMATDLDNDAPLAFTAVGSLPGWASLDAGTLTLRPDHFVVQGMASTPFTLTLEARDAYDGGASRPLTVTVNDVNGPPAFTTPTPIAADEGDTPIVPLSASDPDNDAVTFSQTGTWPAWAQLLTGPSRVALNPDFNVATAIMPTVAMLQITATDGRPGHDVVRALQVTITNVNRPPTLASLPDVIISEGQGQAISLSPPVSGDPDGESLTFVVDGGTKSGITIATFDIQTSTINLAPQCPASTVSPFSMSVTVSDLSGGSASRSFNVTVLPANSAPTVSQIDQFDIITGQIAAGATTTIRPVQVRAVPSDCQNNAVKLEAEVRFVNDAFDGGVTHTGSLAAPPTNPTVDLTGLVSDTQYKWRVRGVDEQGAAGAWVPFNNGNFAFRTPIQDIGGRICVNGCTPEPVTTNNGTVTIDLTPVTASVPWMLVDMQFSNDNVTYTPSTPKPFSVNEAGWGLSGGNGSKTVYARVRDSATPAPNTAVFSDTITLDATPPMITSFVVAGGAVATNQNLVTLTFTATDNGTGIAQYLASNDGTTFSTINPVGTMWNLTSGNGTKTVYLRVIDGAGNPANANDSVIYDATAPTLAGIQIRGGAAYTPTTMETVTLTSPADIGGSMLAQVCWGSTAATVNNCLPYAPSFPVTLTTGDSIKTVYVKLRDGAGNESTVQSAGITLDTTPPVAGTPSINSGATYTISVNVTVTVVASDTNPGIEAAFSTNGGGSFGAFNLIPGNNNLPAALPAGDGVKSVMVKVRDAAGNESVMPYPSDSITLDGTPPSITLFNVNMDAPATNSANVSLYFAASDLTSGLQGSWAAASNDGTTFGNLPLTTSPQAWLLSGADGMKTVTFRATDAAGNSATLTDTIFLDATPPTLTNLVLNGGATYANDAGLTVTGVGADTTSGVNAIAFALNGGMFGSFVAWDGGAIGYTVALGDGLKTVTAKVRDSAGNESVMPYPSDGITLDLTAPVLTSITANGGAAWTTDAGLTLSGVASDVTSGVGQVAFSTNGGGSFAAFQTWSASSMPFTVPLGDGSKTVTAKVRDNAGNESVVPYANDAIGLDTTAPTGTVTIAGGAVAVQATSTTYAVTASDTTSMVFQMCVRESPATQPALGDSCWAAYSTASQALVLSAGDGTKTLYAWFKDNAGLISALAATDTIILDSVNPALTSAAINGGAPYANTATASVTLTGASDTGSGLFQVCVSSTTPVPDPGSCVPYVNPAPGTLAAGEGLKTLYVKVKDASGRSSAEVSDTITVDTIRPTGTVSIAAGATYTTSQLVTLTLSAMDMAPSSGMAQMCLKTVNTPPTGPLDPCFEAYNTTKASFDLGIGNGTKTVYAWFMDNADNISITASDTIVFDNTPPAIVTGVVGTAGHRQVIVQWAATTDTGGSGLAASPYEVGVSTTSGSGYVYQSAQATLSRTVTALDNQVPSYFVVRAYDNAGNFSTSAEMTASPRFPFAEFQQRLPTGFALVALAQRTDGVSEIAVGNYGVALYTTNDWLTSQRIDTGANESDHLYGITVDDANRYHVVGANGFYAYSSDGLHWTQLPIPSTSTFYGVVQTGSSCPGFGCGNYYVAVGSAGKIFRRFSALVGGFGWVEETPGASTQALRGVAQNDSYTVAVGDNGSMWRSLNTGASWTQLTPSTGYTTADFVGLTPRTNTLTNFYVAVVPPSAVAPNNSALLELNASTPSMGPEGVVTNISRPYAVTGIGDQGIFLSGYDSSGAFSVARVVKFDDVAQTSTIQAMSSSWYNDYAYAISARTTQDITWVGGYGQITTTITGGTSWTSRSSGMDTSINDFVLSNTGAIAYAVGPYLTNYSPAGGLGASAASGGPTWCNTTSGTSINWNAATIQGSGSPYFHPALIVGSGGNTRYTSGTFCPTYNVGTSPTAEDLLDAKCFDTGIANPCVAVGNHETIIRGTAQTMAGVNSNAAGASYMALAIYNYLGSNYGLITSSSGQARLYNLTSGALSAPVSVSVGTVLVDVAAKPDGTTILALPQTSAVAGVYRNTTGGSGTWTLLSEATLNFTKYGIAYGSGTTWYLSGASGNAWKSTNDGTSWTQLTTNTTITLTGVAGRGLNDVWLWGSGGVILHSTTGGQ